MGEGQRPEGEAIWDLGSRSPDGLPGGGETLVYLGQGPHSHTLNGLSCQPIDRMGSNCPELAEWASGSLGFEPRAVRALLSHIADGRR